MNKIYFTVRNTSGGFYGHQLKDLVGGYTLGKFLNLEYLHSYYPYLEFIGLGNGRRKIEEIDYNIDSIIVGGPLWRGISYENAVAVKDRFSEYYTNNRELLIYFVNALRLLPYQTYQWYKKGLIKVDLFDGIVSELTKSFSLQNETIAGYFDRNTFNVAIQIRQGEANDREKFPEHFTNTSNARYMYPVEHYLELIDKISQINTVNEKKFHIYTEGYNNDVLEILNKIPNVEVHLSFTTNKNENAKAYEDFMHLVRSDLLVATTSSFSSMAAYFRKGKATLFHPHDHLMELPEPNYFPIDTSGNFDSMGLSRVLR